MRVAILNPIDLSIGYVVYLSTTNYVEKDSWQDIYICLGYTFRFTVTYGSSSQDEQFGTPLILAFEDHSGDMAIL